MSINREDRNLARRNACLEACESPAIFRRFVWRSLWVLCLRALGARYDHSTAANLADAAAADIPPGPYLHCILRYQNVPNYSGRYAQVIALTRMRLLSEHRMSRTSAAWARQGYQSKGEPCVKE
jgi:hypothetical protein